MDLLPHAPGVANGVTVRAGRIGQRLLLEYQIEMLADVTFADAPPGRADGLWQHTCFEAFIAGAGTGYLEFNFAPSGAWAAYVFDDYRAGIRNADVVPRVTWIDGKLAAQVDVATAGDWQVNLSAIIEETDGTKSYWALAHPDGPPDFHDPACFVLDLPAVG
ncbi:MAG: DOMON-like domain-containing protein [Pseudomonadota bacterium]